MPLLHETAVAETASAKKGGRVSFRKSVLVVDDEPALAVLIKRIFESLGCTAHSHTDPTAALNDFQANMGGYDLIITDQTMPGLTGAELLKRARALRPDVDVIVCTGHSESLDEAKAAELGASAFLRKPITLSELIKTLTSLGW
jgi:CheY-like chemotaxis protein